MFTQKNKWLILSLTVFLAVFLLSGCASNTNNETTAKISKEDEMQFEKNLAEYDKKEAEQEAQMRAEKVLYKVIKVVDGDTIDVDIDGKTERLRLIGMDTPETVDPRKPVQCFGKEASNKAKEILDGKMVELESDNGTQGERDKYGRLLRFVYLEDGTFFNKTMITEGYAHEYTYQSIPYKYQAEFKEAEKQARENKKGLWGDLCNGDSTQSIENKNTPITPAPALTSEKSTYTCNCSKTCDQLSCDEAQYQLNTCHCSRRDRDGDGVACDTQCQ